MRAEFRGGYLEGFLVAELFDFAVLVQHVGGPVHHHELVGGVPG